jgi:hypothetical protein
MPSNWQFYIINQCNKPRDLTLLRDSDCVQRIKRFGKYKAIGSGVFGCGCFQSQSNPTIILSIYLLEIHSILELSMMMCMCNEQQRRFWVQN